MFLPLRIKTREAVAFLKASLRSSIDERKIDIAIIIWPKDDVYTYFVSLDTKYWSYEYLTKNLFKKRQYIIDCSATLPNLDKLTLRSCLITEKQKSQLLNIKFYKNIRFKSGIKVSA